MDRYEQIRHYANEILRVARNALLMNYRFFDRVIYQLKNQESDTIYFGSDGQLLYYKPEELLRSFRQNPIAVEWMILHTLFHCLYLHPFLSVGKDPFLWNVASDVYVSHILLVLKKGDPSLQSFIPPDCQSWISDLQGKVKYFSASGLYAHFQRCISEGSLNAEILMARSLPLMLDEHTPWYPPEASPEEEKEESPSQEDSPKKTKVRLQVQKDSEGELGEENEEGEESKGGENQPGNKEGEGEGESQGENDAFTRSYASYLSRMEQASEAWKELARQVEVALNANLVKAQGLDPGMLSSTLEHITRENESYESFLRRFSSIQEEVRLDMDEFDYIYYTLGMQYYGNVPLIEPLEYKEIPAIREFIIVLDTSGSCSDELLRRFLTKTYDILSEEQLFGTTLHVHILQCDAAVQSDVLIESQEELKKYTEAVTVLGRGGTDFRPAFTYVDKLIDEEKIDRLDGLLYFTDGWGTYPTAPTSYPTAFIFSEVTKDLPVPAWAMRVYIEGMEDLK